MRRNHEKRRRVVDAARRLVSSSLVHETLSIASLAPPIAAGDGDAVVDCDYRGGGGDAGEKNGEFGDDGAVIVVFRHVG